MRGCLTIQKVGIPSALYYFYYHPLWRCFFAELGLEPIFSPPTNQEILARGLSSCVDGACLPVKAYVGHCQTLAEQGLELLFIPEIISLFKGEYICPNFMGLRDLVKQYLPPSIRLLSPVLDARKGRGAVSRAYWHMGREFALLPKVKRAWRRAVSEQQTFVLAQQAQLAESSSSKRLNILLLGPRYLVDDQFLNGNLSEKLGLLDARVFTAAQLADVVSWNANSMLSKRLFWTGARRSIGALEHLTKRLDGVITMAPFGCGAESLLGTVIDQRIKANHLGKLELNIDEHTSELGMLTRLEAFCDLLERKKVL